MTAVESIRHVAEWRHMVEDFRPLASTLEWQLSTLHWTSQGITPFIESQVPFLVNNNGRLSTDAAALFFANCQEAFPGDRQIDVLELGAGTGLFARYFLDEFRSLWRTGIARFLRAAVLPRDGSEPAHRGTMDRMEGLRRAHWPCLGTRL